MNDLRRRLASDPTDASALSGLAGAVQGTDPLRSAALYGRAYASTGRAALAFMKKRTTAMHVKGWHIHMLNDMRRNKAFAEAIRRSVGKQTSVLEIGVGSGLLSMIAANAGARRVVGCEESSIIAGTARRIIANNRLSDRITLIAKKSTEISVGRELPEAADLVIAELVSADLLSEHLIPSIEDARARLAKPGAAVIPRGAKIKAALVELDRSNALRWILDARADFDLSAFADLAPPTMPLPEDARPRRLSAIFDLFAFDFMSTASVQPQTNGVEVTAESTGIVHGVLQWIELDLAPSITYENRPSFAGELAPWSHWPAIFHFSYTLHKVAPGDRILIEGQHNRTTLLVVPHGRR